LKIKVQLAEKMSSDAVDSTFSKPVAEFKSSSFNTPVLVVYTCNLAEIDACVAEKIAQAPDFFKYSPIIIDLTQCASSITLAHLIDCLRNHFLLPIGVTTNDPQLQQQAIECYLPLHSLKKRHSPAPDIKINPSPEPAAPPKVEEPASVMSSMLIDHPIRSGQRIYAKGDLIILSHVSAGAEVMAEGNIHIYGSLRGRALAGVQDNNQARIFCLDLKAELVSIAGHYKINEELDLNTINKPIQIFLEDKTLIINEL
jgi:septum site-determining protein MinC